MSTEQQMGAEPVYPFQELDAQGMPRSAACVGLTKRELLAAMAMQGFCALPGIGDDSTAKTIASMAVEHADALLAELAKVTP